MSQPFAKIFIGGTGRSGTTILLHGLYRHPDLYAVPIETKFLVSSSGMCDLVDALTTRYAIGTACDALERFDRLMRFLLTERERPVGTEFNVLEIFGEENYYKALNAFVDRLTRLTFVTRFPPGRFGQHHYPSEVTGANRVMGRFFPDRQELLSICRQFVDALFQRNAEARGKNGWVEKTPANLMRLEFLQELYPDSLFIHIKRDPRGVIYSQTKQPWAPGDVREAARYMEDTYRAWFDRRKQLNLSARRYLEVTLEELVADTFGTLNRIADAANIAPYSRDAVSLVVEAMERYWGCPLDSAEIALKLNPWRNALSAEDLGWLNAHVGEFVEGMGFEI